MLHRRRLLLGAAAAVSASAASPVLAAGAAQPSAAASEPGEARRLAELMDDIARRYLMRGPELATSLGLDTGDLAWTKAKLSDYSLAAIAEDKQLTAEDVRRLHGIDRRVMGGMDAVNYDTVDFMLGVQDEANRRFDYGSEGAGQPYVLSPLTGGFYSVPSMLDSQHTIETKADADAYLARLEAFGRQMDQEIDKCRHDAGVGVIPPDFLIDKTLVQLKALAATPADKSSLVESVARRAAEKGIKGDYRGQASRLYELAVLPAVERQIELLQSWRPSAVHDAGVWRLKDGAEYYALSLRQYTTSSVTPEEAHRIGLEQVASLSAQADALMKAQGLTKGTVGERYRAMYEDPRYRYPNTDAGKDKLIADLNVKVKAVRAQLPQWFATLPKSEVEIRRVPKAIEAGAPGGYYYPPPVDGSRPGVYWINLRDTAEVPSWTLPTLTFHESIPGHHLQLSLANEAAGLPLLRKMLTNSGYDEGWALYAEQLAVEMGMYEHDPLGHIGQLHDAIFRGVRLVVDTGMHDKRWSREQALKYYIDAIGDPEPAAVTEVERYVAWPGQACSYMVGKLTWLRLREQASKAMGRRFDIRRFHDVGLLSGDMPLQVLERRIGDYVAGRA